MCRNTIASFQLDEGKQNLTVNVSIDAVAKLKEILSEKQPVGKAFTKLAETYFFMCWLNKCNIFHVRRADLANMIYSKHEDRLRHSMKILEDHDLINSNYHFNPKTQRYYYTYTTNTFDFEKISTSTWCLEYNIPELMSYIVFNKTNSHIVSCGCDNNMINYSFSSNSYSPIYRHTDSILDVEEQTFRQQFIGWYDELSFNDDIIYPRPHYSEKDGRLYHQFHHISKAERESNVFWDGEHVEEVWDAHSSFFIILGYYLKHFHRYESVDDRMKFSVEADKLIDMAINNRLYSNIMDYHNSKSQIFISREDAKELTQMYKNLSYSYLFRKKDGKIIDGDIKKYWWSIRFQYIDEFFRLNFPSIRDFFLSYSRHYDFKSHDYFRKDGSKGNKFMCKSVSDLQRGILPYELKLISLGLCRDLAMKYDIKSITVHDAIYMKKSDAKKHVDINDLLQKRIFKKYDINALF